MFMCAYERKSLTCKSQTEHNHIDSNTGSSSPRANVDINVITYENGLLYL
jgi:hypothetical protein